MTLYLNNRISVIVTFGELYKMGNKQCCKKKPSANGNNNVVPIRSTTARRVPRIAGVPGDPGRSAAAAAQPSKRNNYVVLEDQLVDLDDPSSTNLGVLEARYLLGTTMQLPQNLKELSKSIQEELPRCPEACNRHYHDQEWN